MQPDPNAWPDPYVRVEHFLQMPPGRTLGATSAIAIDHAGHIWIAERCGANNCDGSSLDPILEFDQNGVRLRTLGKPGVCGDGPDTFHEPNAVLLAPDGDIFVADGHMPQDGALLAIWPQFSRPSGLYIDQHDVLYVSDSESLGADGYGHHPGWKRGIRIGSAADGSVSAFIPDPEPDPDHTPTSGGEGVAADGQGHVYSAEVGPRAVVRFEHR